MSGCKELDGSGAGSVSTHTLFALVDGGMLIFCVARFFSPNIGFSGRLARGILGTVLLIGGIIAADFTLWAAIPLVVTGLFCIFEAVRGWCLLRACGLRTRR
jgi:hypothetical protein